MVTLPTARPVTLQVVDSLPAQAVSSVGEVPVPLVLLAVQVAAISIVKGVPDVGVYVLLAVNSVDARPSGLVSVFGLIAIEVIVPTPNSASPVWAVRALRVHDA